ncbi:unnamed protein product [Cuscuta epithymum]|uniref:PGG domain-containing protein n=1 Tax=Cuscuta epithymum TaxID=186058 RepID=A0AAV0F4V3_9ASTE|nr:unnamed protein product [Cuscuta epithymum]
MHQRTSTASGRPSGTDGSDYSFRMVVDSRYQKVAKGKSQLLKIIFIQLCAEGRKRSRSNFLKLYVFGSSIAVLFPATCFAMSQNTLEVLQTFNSLLPPHIEVLKIAAIILGFLVQIFSVATTVSLICNMALPKRAS